MITPIHALHDQVFDAVERHFGPWLPGLFVRLVFAAVLLAYFLNSAMTKIGHGALGFLTVTDSAYSRSCRRWSRRTGSTSRRCRSCPGA